MCMYEWKFSCKIHACAYFFMRKARFEWTKEERKKCAEKIVLTLWQTIPPYSLTFHLYHSKFNESPRKICFFVCTYVCAVLILLFFACATLILFCVLFLIIHGYYWVSLNGIASREFLRMERGKLSAFLVGMFFFKSILTWLNAKKLPYKLQILKNALNDALKILFFI